MNDKRLKKIAKQIADLEKKTDRNNMKDNMSKMESLIQNCTMEEILKIDGIIMKKYLTN